MNIFSISLKLNMNLEVLQQRRMEFLFQNDFSKFRSQIFQWVIHQRCNQSGFFETGISYCHFSRLQWVISYVETFYWLLKSCFIVNEHLENMQSNSFWVTTKIRENLFPPHNFTRNDAFSDTGVPKIIEPSVLDRRKYILYFPNDSSCTSMWQRDSSFIYAKTNVLFQNEWLPCFSTVLSSSELFHLLQEIRQYFLEKWCKVTRSCQTKIFFSSVRIEFVKMKYFVHWKFQLVLFGRSFIVSGGKALVHLNRKQHIKRKDADETGMISFDNFNWSIDPLTIEHRLD